MVAAEKAPIEFKEPTIVVPSGTVLLTGGAGFIGGHTAEKLMKRGNRVVAIDSLTDYYEPKYKQECLSILEAYGSDLFRFCKVDICDKEGLQKIFSEEKPEVVIHLAAQAGVRYSVQHPAEVIKTNVIGTQNIFETAHEAGVRYVVAASSSSVYGQDSVAPFSEDQMCDTPISPYASTKRACEHFGHTFSHLYKMPITMLRFFTVYGPRGRPDMAALKFIQKIDSEQPIDKYGTGDMIREFTYIDDIVDGILRSVDRPNGFKVINLGGGTTHTLNGFIETIETALGKKAIINQLPVQPGDVHITSADQTRALGWLGFKPEISLEEGIKRTVEWYKGATYAHPQNLDVGASPHRKQN